MEVAGTEALWQITVRVKYMLSPAEQKMSENYWSRVLGKKLEVKR
jgi:hypothetical protein